jgi:hypothetical protein
MPLRVKITRELNDGYATASGTISYTTPAGKEVKGPAEIVVKKVTDSEYLFIASNASLFSVLDGKPVEDIYHCMPAKPDPKGLLTFSKFHIKFKTS